MQICIIIGDTRHQHMAYPHRLCYLGKIACAVEDILVAKACELAMLRIVNMLDIKENGIGDSHQLLEIIKPWRLASERLSRCIETGIYAHSMCLLEKFCNKLHLHQSLTTAHGDTTFITPISAIAQSLFKQFVGCHLFAHSRLPRVWVMTIQTSHRTSLHEHYEPYTRSIYRPKGLNTMNISYLHT